MLIALRKSIPKIVVFLLTVILFVIVIGTIMYIVEGPLGNNTDGFRDIPNSIYWAIVTLTTVGYGSAVPVTAFGKLFASIIMLMGYGIIAVPTGIVASALSRNYKDLAHPTLKCNHCLHHIDEEDIYCSACGGKID